MEFAVVPMPCSALAVLLVAFNLHSQSPNRAPVGQVQGRQESTPATDQPDYRQKPESVSGTNEANSSTPTSPSRTRLTGAQFADVTAKPGDSNVEVMLSGIGFDIGMKAFFDGALNPIEVAMVNDGFASIRLDLPDGFDLKARHQLRLQTAAGADAGMQYIANSLIPRGAALATALHSAQVESKELRRYTKAVETKTRLQLAANRAQRESDIAGGRINVMHPQGDTHTVRVANPTCAPDNTLEQAYIRVRRSVVSPHEASDAFGRRLGRHYIVFQVTVENKSSDYQYMLHNVSIDLSRLVGMPVGTYQWAFSTQELSMLRGVPEKGQDYDPRNLTLHALRGVGSVAGAVTGLTAVSIQDIFAGTVAAYNGPFITSFLDLFPDHTATQLNRLSDSAFTANSVVAKKAAKVFAVFVPADLMLTNKESKEYWQEPQKVMSYPQHDFRQADVCVDGGFITEVSALTLRSLSFSDASKVQPGSSASIIVEGSNLIAGDVILHIFDQAIPLESVEAKKDTGQAIVNVPKSYDSQLTYPAYLESLRTGQRTPAVELPSMSKPVLTSATFVDPSKVAAGAAVVVKISGTHLVVGDTMLEAFGGEFPLKDVSADATTGYASVQLPVAYDPSKNIAVKLRTKSGVVSQGLLPAKTITLASAKASGPDAANKVTITLNGSGMLVSDTQAALDNGVPARLNAASDDGTVGTITIAPASGAWPGTHTVQLHTDARGNSVTIPINQ